MEKNPWLMRTWPSPLQRRHCVVPVPGRAPEPPAGIAGHQSRNGDIDGGAKYGLLKIQGQFVAQVGAAEDSAAPAPAAAAEDIAEHVAENVAERVARAETARPIAASAAAAASTPAWPCRS